MKKIIHLISILLITTSLFSEDNLLEISSQSISIRQYTESEYNIKFSSTIDFTTGFDIISNTDDVQITINENSYDTDSLYLKNLNSGVYLISIKKSGYKTIKKWIDLDDETRVVIKVTLERKIGYLNVISDQSNLELFIDGISVQNNQAIPTGYYSITIKGFGYKEESQNITIYTGIPTILNVTLEKAPFKIEGISSDKKIYNPNAYEGFGVNKVEIKVNGPGKGTLVIKNSSENIILSKDLEFLTWSTFYTLEQKFSDGIYSFTIESNEMSQTCYIEVDKDLFVHNIPIYRGLPGLINTSTAERNITSISATTFGLNTLLDNSQVEIPFTYQQNINDYFSFRGGMTLFVNFDNDSNGLELFSGIKLVNNFYNLLYALNINYDFKTTQNDITNDTFSHNIILNTPLTYNFYNLYFTISPKYLYDFTNGIYTLSGGSGIHFDNQLWRFGLSGRVDKTEQEDPNYNFGGEVYYLLPDTQTYTGIVLTSDDDLLFSLMITFSILY